eukprot:3564868-Rhodomonas_salina.2
MCTAPPPPPAVFMLNVHPAESVTADPPALSSSAPPSLVAELAVKVQLVVNVTSTPMLIAPPWLPALLLTNVSESAAAHVQVDSMCRAPPPPVVAAFSVNADEVRASVAEAFARMAPPSPPAVFCENEQPANVSTPPSSSTAPPSTDALFIVKLVPLPSYELGDRTTMAPPPPPAVFMWKVHPAESVTADPPALSCSAPPSLVAVLPVKLQLVVNVTSTPMLIAPPITPALLPTNVSESAVVHVQENSMCIPPPPAVATFSVNADEFRASVDAVCARMAPPSPLAVFCENEQPADVSEAPSSWIAPPSPDAALFIVKLDDVRFKAPAAHSTAPPPTAAAFEEKVEPVSVRLPPAM